MTERPLLPNIQTKRIIGAVKNTWSFEPTKAVKKEINKSVSSRILRGVATKLEGGEMLGDLSVALRRAAKKIQEG